MPVFKFPEHQVGGHKAIKGRLGPLVDDSGRFYKPLQSGTRGSKELAFYESLPSDTSIPVHVHSFFAKFHGTRTIEASNKSGLLPHLVLEDLVSNYANPSIIDAKLGSRTWYPQASEAYFQKCIKKDRESSSVPLGFRISGLQLYRCLDSGYWRPDKEVTQKYTADDLRLVLRKFVSSNQSAELNQAPDCAYAATVYGGSSGILAQLVELKSWFEDQTSHHCYSSSVLMFYDKDSKGRVSGPAVKLIDFAHVVDGDGVIDHNVLGGICSLIKFISGILTFPSLSTVTTSLLKSEQCSEAKDQK